MALQPDHHLSFSDFWSKRGISGKNGQATARKPDPMFGPAYSLQQPLQRNQPQLRTMAIRDPMISSQMHTLILVKIFQREKKFVLHNNIL